MKWYDSDKKRFVLEYEKIKAKYPQLKLAIYKDCISWEGVIHFDPKHNEDKEFISLKVRIVCDDSYPIKAPKVFPIEPEIPEELWGHKWHRWKDGNICYVNPKDWNIDYYVVDVVSKVHAWFVNFLLYTFKIIDKMPDVGMADILEEGGS